MSYTGEPIDFGETGCDPEKVFELADAGDPGSLEPEHRRKLREHLAFCPECRDLYERELELNDFLSSLDFSAMHSFRSVSQGVAMALPTRSIAMRLLWGSLGVALLILALVSLESNGTEPVILLMSILGMCWGLVAGSVKVVHTAFAAAGSTILLLLALGALADLLIAFVALSVSRARRAREV